LFVILFFFSQLKVGGFEMIFEKQKYQDHLMIVVY